MPDRPSPAFALALLSLDGVGRVTAHRLIERFASAEAVRGAPREQVLLRLRGVAVGLDAVVEPAHAGIGLAHQQPALKVVRFVLQVLFQLGDGLHHLGRRTVLRFCFT